MTEVEPFGGLNLVDIKDLVVVNKMRPKIPVEQWGQGLVKLLTNCWAERAGDRPGVKEIKRIVEEMLFDD